MMTVQANDCFCKGRRDTFASYVLSHSTLQLYYSMSVLHQSLSFCLFSYISHVFNSETPCTDRVRPCDWSAFLPASAKGNLHLKFLQRCKPPCELTSLMKCVWVFVCLLNESLSPEKFSWCCFCSTLGMLFQKII